VTGAGGAAAVGGLTGPSSESMGISTEQPLFLEHTTFKEQRPAAANAVQAADRFVRKAWCSPRLGLKPV